MTSPTAPALVGDTAKLHLFKKDLIRKGLKGGILKGPVSTPMIRSITRRGVGGDVKLRNFTGAPWNLTPVGALTEDGVTQGREMDNSTIRSWGVSAAMRTDNKSDEATMQAVRQETNRVTLAEIIGTSVERLETFVNPVTGELAVPKEEVTELQRGLYMSIAQDRYVPTGKPIWIVTLFPEGEVTAMGETTDANGDDARGYDITVTSRWNDLYGTDVVWFFGGPGWVEALADMGFTTEIDPDGTDPWAALDEADPDFADVEDGGEGGGGSGGGGGSVTPLAFTSPAANTVLTDNTPTFTGTAPAGSTVTFRSVAQNNSIIGTAVANGSGVWTFTPIGVISNGTRPISATIGGETVTLAVSVNYTAPATPELTAASFSTNDISGRKVAYGGTGLTSEQSLVLVQLEGDTYVTKATSTGSVGNATARVATFNNSTPPGTYSVQLSYPTDNGSQLTSLLEDAVVIPS